MTPGIPEDPLQTVGTRRRACVRDGESSSIEFDDESPAGTRHFATRLVPEIGGGGTIDFVLGLTQDVTDRKRADEALKRADRRERRVSGDSGPRTAKPACSPSQRSRGAQRRGEPAIIADTRKMMNRQLSHMVRLMDDLLDASRITNDKLTLRKERVPLRSVVDTAVEASHPSLTRPGTS